MGQAFLILALLALVFTATRYLADFTTTAKHRTRQLSSSSRHPFSSPRSADEEADATSEATTLSAVNQEFERYENPNANQDTAPSAAAGAQALTITGSGSDDVGKLIADPVPGVYHLYNQEGSLVETIRQVGGSDNFIRQKDGVDIGTVTKVGRDQFNVYGSDGSLVDTRQLRKN